jgi:cell fate regulator YaaT (PSP1 superfamily)
MGCGSCGTGTSGKPSGCQSNGGCSTGGCNRMNVFDWLAELPLQDSSKPYPVIEVTFNQGSRKEFYRNNTNHIFEKGEWITVEGVSGFDVGQLSLQGELVKLQMKKNGVKDDSAIKRVLRPAAGDDMDAYYFHKAREKDIMIQSRAMAKVMKLEMKIAEVELQADGKKATFFYTADQRVDFRELIKQYATEFKLKVEMRQIGARQESGKVGGIGSCGRELCCSTWLTDFKSVNTSAARYQNLSINQTKLSGQCGRLKCCLNYELDTYMDALREFPTDADTIEIAQGRAGLQKRDIFKNLMWYSFSGSNKQYPLTIARVREIVALNKQGIKPEELQAVDLEATKSKPSVKVDMGFVNDVGQVSLKGLERKDKKNKQKKAGQQTEGNKKAGQEQTGKKPQPNNPKQGQAQRPQQVAEGKPQQPPRDRQPNKEKQPSAKPQQQQQAKGQQQPKQAQQQQPKPAKPAAAAGNNPDKQPPQPGQGQRSQKQQAGKEQRPQQAAGEAKPQQQPKEKQPQQQQNPAGQGQRSKRFNKPQADGDNSNSGVA